MNLIPTVIERTNNSERAYDLYSRLLKDRIVFIDGEVTDESSSIIVAQLLYLNAKGKEDISMYINSPGGSVTAGFAIYDTMNFIDADVSTISVGMCASIAAFLLSSGAKGKRYALKNSEIMIHQPLGGAQGQATEIQIAAERIIKIKQKLAKMLAKNTGQPLKKIENDVERDYFMDAEEALNYGIVDKII
jgi:ATP-dependent Clp protease protease subunit